MDLIVIHLYVMYLQFFLSLEVVLEVVYLEWLMFSLFLSKNKLILTSNILWFSSLKVVYIKEEPQYVVTAEIGLVHQFFMKENAVEKDFIVNHDVQHIEAIDSTNEIDIKEEPDDTVSKVSKDD